ncbi:TPA: host nuclease inhibitor protein [Pseudomonas aeruginosa]|nr:host nuclease inhibitor protein [Pseudomonas aeruginosa]
MSQITIEDLMDQAQVYASAWSLVGGQFDGGGQLEVANQEKAHLEVMLEDFLEQTKSHAGQVELKEIAQGLIHWHSNKVKNFQTVLNTPEDTEIRLDTGGKEPLVLAGDVLKGFRVGLTIGLEWIEKFTLSIERSVPAPSDEEE